MDHAVFFISRVVTVLFFIGLCGCVPVVVISWVSILKDEFASSDTAPRAEAKK